MAGAAVLGRLTWLVADVVDLVQESATARSVVLDVPGWPGHLAGQHVDLRLTAPDGYSARRSYSLASAPDGSRVTLTVQLVSDGEVSPYLVEELRRGDQLELRGPIGGWFVWRPEQVERVLLVAGGSGVVPLMSMARTRAVAGRAAPMRLLYSTRDQASAMFLDELRELAAGADGLGVYLAWTRRAPDGSTRAPGRIDGELLARAGWRPDLRPTCYVCGPTGFVETVADLLVAAGHEAGRIRTERFGPTGG
jgi:ferredoxin-NADP reductase